MSFRRLETDPRTPEQFNRRAKDEGSPKKGQIPSGVVDGVNTVFNLVDIARDGSLEVYRDGLFDTAFVTTIVSGVTRITMTTAPATSIAVSYRA